MSVSRLGLSPLAELRFWLTALVVLTPIVVLYWLSFPFEWIYFAIDQGTLRPNLWR